MTWTAGRLMVAMALMAMPGLLLGGMFPLLLNGPTTALTLSVIGASLPYFYVNRKRKKRLSALEDQLPDALDFLARSMRAGHAFTISMEMLGQELEDPLGQEFRGLFNEQNLGAPLDIALRNFARRVPLVDARFFTTDRKSTRLNSSHLGISYA